MKNIYRGIRNILIKEQIKEYDIWRFKMATISLIFAIIFLLLLAVSTNQNKPSTYTMFVCMTATSIFAFCAAYPLLISKFKLNNDVKNLKEFHQSIKDKRNKISCVFIFSWVLTINTALIMVLLDQWKTIGTPMFIGCFIFVITCSTGTTYLAYK